MQVRLERTDVNDRKEGPETCENLIYLHEFMSNYTNQSKTPKISEYRLNCDEAKERVKRMDRNETD